MRTLKTGDPCPCCGQPIKLTDPEALRLLALLADIMGLPEQTTTGRLLNPAGEYAVKFAENHGISVSEAMEQPMVKARFQFFADTGI